MPPVDRSSSLVACTRVRDASEGLTGLGWWLWGGQLEIIWSFTVLLRGRRRPALPPATGKLRGFGSGRSVSIATVPRAGRWRA